MKSEHLAFLFGGFAFGILVGYGMFHVVQSRPLQEGAGVARTDAIRPQGPPSPTQMPGAPAGPVAGGEGPMVAQINELKLQLSQDPENFQLLVELGSIYDQVSMGDRAVEFYERASKVRPDNAELVARVAEIHYDAMRWVQATPFLERLSELTPESPDVWTNLGASYRGQQRPEDALRAFEKAHEVDPGYWPSLWFKVVVAVELQRLDVAREAMASLEAIDPRPPGISEQRLRELREALETAATGERS